MPTNPQRIAGAVPVPERGGLTGTAQAAARGEQGALERLVRTSYADIWRLCGALVDEPSAEDLAQETYLRATRALRRFRGQASARTWLFAIARNVCMDELRRRHRVRRRDERLAIVAHETDDADLAGEVTANDLLLHLDPDRRAAFVLTQLFRLSYEEAAAVCVCPTGTIRSRVARARDELIAMLSERTAQAEGGPDSQV